MTTPTNPVLAEFVSILCKISSYAKANGIEYALTSHFSGAPFLFSAEEMFSNKIVAPIIRHLIEEEMEKRGFKLDYSFRKGTHSFSFMCGPVTEDKNKTRAVALAAYQTGER